MWSTYDELPVICNNPIPTTITWPIQTPPFGTTDPQYPSISYSQIKSFKGWTITRDQDGESHTIYNDAIVTFVPPTTGTYTVSVTANIVPLSSTSLVPATSALVTQPYVFTNIPKITATDPYITEYSGLQFTTPVGGFLIEHPLKGWNYNTYAADSKAFGARPYWAVLDSGKDSTTRFKGLYSWGYPDTYIDEYLPKTNPNISPLEIKFGNILEYFRKGYTVYWNQPFTYKQFVGLSQWCQISADATQSSNLSAIYASKQKPDPIVIATTIPSDIELSNTIDGASVQVYYYALNSFVWTVSVLNTQDVTTPSPSSYFISRYPWTNLGNRFYPTIANVPTLEEVYSLEDVGGYFLPQNLGASLFLNKDYTTTLELSGLSGSYLVEDNSIHIGGRGRTKQDQNTLYGWEENNQWLKESATTGELAGAVKKSLTKSLQTFIPYQSNLEETALGLVTPRSRLSPWGGVNDEEWTDVANEPKGFTGVRNVSAWAASQVLKQSEKEIYCWASDIYGNQYGLFKQLSGVPVADHANVAGELWVRTNNQFVSPAYACLSSTFDTFKSLDLTIYSQITGSGIEYIDCYFDTLFIETSSCVLFVKLNYDYDTASFVSAFDETRYKLLNDNLRFDANWVFSSEKNVVNLFTELEGNTFSPALWELDLSTRKYKKAFPIDVDSLTNLTTNLSGFEINSLSRGTLHYNGSLNTFLVTYTGTTTSDRMFVVDFYIKKENLLKLTKIDFYVDTFNPNSINEPPIVLTPYLSTINVGLSTFAVSVSASNNPISYSLLNYTSNITVDNSGTFVGMLSSGLHHVNYMVSNNVGDSIYCLTLSAL